MTIPYQDADITLHHGDCIEVLATLPEASIDAVICDPPYSLGFMGRAWDTFGQDVGRGAQARTQHADEVTTQGRGHSTSAGPYLAAGVDSLRAAGMPFQTWCTAWATECLRVLKPGGHLLAFGGSRTWHRLAAGIEDAGFEIRDSMAWLYGSGFPKSLDVSKAIDKRKVGSEEVDAFKRALGRAVAASGKSRKQINTECGFTMRFDVTFDRDPDGWGCSLPTPEQYDVICRVLAMDAAGDVSQLREWPRTSMEKLYEVVGYEHRANSPAGIVGLGRGAVPVARELTAPTSEAAKQWSGWGTALKPAFEPIVCARKPLTGTVAANVVEHGTGALNIDSCRIEAGQDYQDKCASVVGLDSNRNGSAYGEWQGVRQDSSHAAGRWPTNVVLDGEMADQLDAQTEGGASRFFPVFRYEAKAPAEERPSVNGVAHPTVKPVDLMRWLVRLVTPPGGLVLDPFGGSGTTGEACVLEHKRAVLIEREADYLPLIVSRLTKPMAVGFDFGAMS